ncbi:MAG: 2-amino-4-hydroxy-6-hydroxymethyldihydropteridine pyrophosphokinase [Bacteroidetes bacterium]|jgi:2-amino-4-hydroxy-6-hydroxymethyldihydropteridine diphosphokinase|nr:2-amino-4-hydroxy-6-hydroxymethyldihydropteridine pyrophosphokinase [Bacteroidota bacterium]
MIYNYFLLYIGLFSETNKTKYMNTAVVMLGANVNGEENLTLAKERLSEFFQIVDESAIIVTKPIGKKYKTDFHNQAIKILSDDTAKETARHFKQIENELGRSSVTNLRGEVPIDIDLIFWNGVQKRSDYDKYPFVRRCVDEIKDKPELFT